MAARAHGAIAQNVRAEHVTGVEDVCVHVWLSERVGSGRVYLRVSGERVERDARAISYAETDGPRPPSFAIPVQHAQEVVDCLCALGYAPSGAPDTTAQVAELRQQVELLRMHVELLRSMVNDATAHLRDVAVEAITQAQKRKDI